MTLATGIITNKKGATTMKAKAMTMNEKITINCYEKSVFGRTCIYCDDDDLAKSLQDLTGQKTLSLAHLNALALMGCNVNLRLLNCSDDGRRNTKNERNTKERNLN